MDTVRSSLPSGSNVSKPADRACKTHKGKSGGHNVTSTTGKTIRNLRKRPSSSQPQSTKQRRIKATQQTASKKPTATRPAQITWYPPKRTEIGQIVFPEKCLSDDIRHRPDGDALRELVDKHNFTEMVYLDSSDIAGTGVFATRDYDEGEFIGFYKGRIVKHFPVDQQFIDDYQLKTGTSSADLTSVMYATWQDIDGKTEVIKLPDTHTLWTYMFFEGTDIELGIDGLQNGNALAYLNHSTDNNVIPISICSKRVAVHDTQKIIVKPGQHNDQTVMAAIVAARPIKAREELTFDYFPEAEGVDFSKVGRDIFQYPELYYDIDHDQITPKASFPSAEALAPQPECVFDFEKNLPDDDKQLLLDCRTNRMKALKILVNGVLRGNERYLNLYLFYCLCHLKLPIDYILWGRRTSPISHIFPNVKSMREHISTTFSPADSARMLTLAEEPGEMKRSTLEQTASCTELSELVRRIEAGEPDTPEVLKEFLFCRFYRSKASAEAKRNTLASVVERLQGVPYLLDKPGKEWFQEDYYRFAIDEGVFLNDIDRIQYMPISYLKRCLSSNTLKDKTTGLKLLNEFCCAMLAKKTSICTIASLLSKGTVPNPFSPNFPADTAWKESDIYRLEPTRLLHRSSCSDESDTHLSIWLRKSADRKQKRAAFDAMKIRLENGSLSSSYIIYKMKCHGLSVDDIYQKIRDLKGRHFQDYTADKIRADVYKHLPAQSTLPEKINVLGSAIEVIFAKLANQPEDMSLDQLNTILSEEELKTVQDELNHPDASNGCKMQWYKLLKVWPVPCLYKILLTHMTGKRCLNDVAGKFTAIQLPIITSLAPVECISDEPWDLSTLSQALYTFKIFDFRTKNGLHIAPIMAANLPDQHNLQDITIEGQCFSDWITKEVKSQKYTKDVLAELEDRGYLTSI